MRRWLYPGTFDPPTRGHLDLIRRALPLCDELLVAVSDNKEKRTSFSVAERVRMVEAMVEELADVRVIDFDTLLTVQVEKRDIAAVLRGVRAFSDFEYELVMALTNRKLLDHFETIFMMPSQEYLFVSSSRLKELVRFGRAIDEFVPPLVAKKLRERIGGA